MFGYDDSLDAFGVHAVGGIIGAILTGVFAREFLNPAVPADAATGTAAVAAKMGLLDGNPGQVLTQAYGVACTLVYCAVATFIILKIIDVIIGLRVSDEVERDGLDLNLHGEVVP
jgi:Amt family ammonium transporter